MNKILRLIFCTLVCCLVSGLIQQSVMADTTDTAHQIYMEILSPFCPGRALNDCPTEKASELKSQIQTDLNQGKTKEQIITELEKTYGSSIKALPDFSGANVLAWFLPILFVVVGLFLIRKTVRGRKS